MKRPIYQITLHFQNELLVVRKYSTSIASAIKIIHREIIKSDGWIAVKDQHGEISYVQTSTIVRITAKEEVDI